MSADVSVRLVEVLDVELVAINWAADESGDVTSVDVRLGDSRVSLGYRDPIEVFIRREPE